MSSDPTHPCRDWLGIEPADVEIPHRLLGIRAGENDPLAIVRAADRRLAVLRATPQDGSWERDALIARVEAARDGLLAAVAVGAPPAQPAQAPPPVPSMLPAPDESAEPSMAINIRRTIRPRRSNNSATGLIVTVLTLAVTALTAYVAWPHLTGTLKSKTLKKDDEVAARDKPQPEAPVAAKAVQEPAPRDFSESDPGTSTTSSRRPTPDPEPDPSREEIDVEQVRRQVDDAVKTAFAAIKSQDFEAAATTLSEANEAARGDRESTDRIRRWRQLVVYAKRYPEYRDKALANASKNRPEIESGSRSIVVVELTPEIFVYRDSRDPGRQLELPRAEMPKDIEDAIVRAWFEGGGLAANYLYLGAAAIARPRPDLNKARADWMRASQGGEPDGDVLLGILNDSVVRSRSRRQ